MKRHHSRCVLTLLVLALCACLASEAPGQPRAEPPEWTDDELRVFFPDAREALVGPRPDFAKGARRLADAAPPADAEAASQEGYRWSELISTGVIETEIKRQAQRVTAATSSASVFKGGGYRQARDALSVIAMMFGLAAQHDEPARWRDDAAALASLFARAAAGCKVGTDASYRDAAARSQDLADLIRGSRPDTPPAEPDQTWPKLADRPPLMRRMEEALDVKLGPLVGGERVFSRGADDARHEAEVLAFLAQSVAHEGYYYADDDDYAAFAAQLRDAAAELARAASQEAYEPAREAHGRASKACVDCHDNFRG